MKKYKKIIIAVLAVLLLCAGGIVASAFIFDVDMENGITYVGNKQYSDDELTKRIFGDDVNALSYTLFKSKEQVKIPFVQRYVVEADWPDKLTVTIYEKPIIGYICYMGSNMYFDKDGLVVESSPEIIADVPQITGMEFKSIVLGEKLSVENTDIFDRIMEFVQDFDKNDLRVNRIHFDSSLNATLYFGNVKVLLGDNNNLSEKMHELKLLFPNLIGLAGTLHMEEYSPENPKIFFTKENSKN